MLIRDSCVCGGSTIIRSNGIETVCHQKNPSNDVKYITHMQIENVNKIYLDISESLGVGDVLKKIIIEMYTKMYTQM